MTATFFLVRHAVHVLQDRVLVGRDDVPLSDEGRLQASRVAERLATERLSLLHASPQLRTRETAGFIADRTGLPVEIASALAEVDLGRWTGRSRQDLAGDPDWKQWNEARTVARVPGGETMLEVQLRVVDHIDALRRTHDDGRIAVVSHGDVIRAAVLYYLGVSIADFDRVEIDPASITTLVVGDWGARIVAMNERVQR